MIEQQDKTAAITAAEIALRHCPDISDIDINALANTFNAHRLAGYAQAERDIVMWLRRESLQGTGSNADYARGFAHAIETHQHRSAK